LLHRAAGSAGGRCGRWQPSHLKNVVSGAGEAQHYTRYHSRPSLRILHQLRRKRHATHRFECVTCAHLIYHHHTRSCSCRHRLPRRDSNATHTVGKHVLVVARATRGWAYLPAFRRATAWRRRATTASMIAYPCLPAVLSAVYAALQR
jgi:hypothetical protein